jgi:1,4-dihydroxy-2-naphthoyl-CoA synthase
MTESVRTSDLYFAAFLQTIGCKIVTTEQKEGKHFFCFEDEQSRKDLKEIYFNKDLKSAIPALEFANSIRSLKTLCYVR